MIPQWTEAQQFEWSNLERFRNKTSYNRIIGANQYGYYMLRSGNFDIRRRVYIERYRETLGKDFTKKIQQKRGVNLVNAFVNDLGISLWSSAYNDRTGNIDLYVDHLDEDAEPVGQRTIIASANPRNYSDQGDFVIIGNNFGTHYVVVFTELAPQGKSYLNVRVYDQHLELLANRKEKLDFNELEFEVNQIIVDTAGNAFVLISGINHEMEKRSPERVGVHLFALSNRSDWYDFYLNTNTYFLNSPIMELDDVNKRLIVSGLYSEKSRELSKGILDFAIDRSTFHQEHHRFIPFDKELIQGIAGKKAAEAGEELAEFVIRYMVTRSDGGFMVFGEEFSVSQQSYTYYANGMAQVSTRSVYVYGKIFMLANDRSGNNQWSKIISKTQSSVNDFGYYSSFALCKKKDQIHILFNDKLKTNGGVLNFVLYNDNSLDHGMLFGNQGSFISIVPGETRQLDANTLLIPTSKDRKFALVKIIF